MVEGNLSLIGKTPPKERASSSKILAIDFGSSKASFVVWDTPSMQVASSVPGQWITYELQKTNFRETEMKWLNGEYLQQRMAETFNKMGRELISINEIALTGLTNNLVVRAKDGRTRIILDEPSLTSDLNEEQATVLREEYHVDSLKLQSALMKLIALRNHPEYVRFLFGDNANFEDLQFGTLMSLVMEGFSGRDISQIPQADIRAFAANTGISNPEELNNLLVRLGLPVLNFDSKPTLNGREMKVTIVNDLEAEATVMDHLFETKLLGKDEAVICVDTVGKVLTRKNGGAEAPDIKKIGNLNYRSQRVGLGAMHQLWFCDLLHLPNSARVYDEMADEVLPNLFGRSKSKFIFFPDHNKRGVLGYCQDDGRVQIISKEQALRLADLSDEFRLQMIDAITRGTIYGLIQKAEMSWRPDLVDEGKSLVFYGGLTAKRPIWLDFLAEVSPYKISTIEVPSGAEAASIAVSRESGGGDMNKLSINRSATVLTPKPAEERRQEYEEWREKTYTFLPYFSLQNLIIFSRLSFLRAGKGRVVAGNGAEVILSIQSFITVSNRPSETRSLSS